MVKRTPEEHALRDSWCTPDWCLNLCEALIGRPFELDLAASPGNAIAPAYLTAQGVIGMCNDQPTAWLNPPFSDAAPHVRELINLIASDWITHAGALTLGDPMTEYWCGLEDAGFQRVRIRGRWGCVPPPGVTESSAQRTMVLWVYGASEMPALAHWTEYAQLFGQPRRRY